MAPKLKIAMISNLIDCDGAANWNGLSRIVLLVGAGYAGTILLNKGKLSDLIGELQSLVKGLEKSGESNADSDPIAAQDSADEDLCSETGFETKLQFSVVFMARWIDAMSMAEIMNIKGNLLKSMGINRNGKIYISIEETLFLLQIGALLLVDESNREFCLKEIYTKVEEEKSNCSWEGFKIYQHLKSLGYIVGRLGIPWSLKSTRISTMLLEDASENDNTTQFAVDRTSITKSLKALQLDAVYPLSNDHLALQFNKTSLENSKFVVHLPAYEIYLPNSQFKKTCPGDPNFVVYSASGHPPLLSDLKELERQSNGLPLKIGHVDDGRVSLFSFDEFELPLLP